MVCHIIKRVGLPWRVVEVANEEQVECMNKYSSKHNMNVFLAARGDAK